MHILLTLNLLVGSCQDPEYIEYSLVDIYILRVIGTRLELYPYYTLYGSINLDFLHFLYAKLTT